MHPRPIDKTEILDLAEIAAVVGDLRRRSKKKKNGVLVIEPARNLALFRLSACCGLRASEIAGLDVRDVHTGIARPYLFVRGHTSKRGQSRRVPLTWDADTNDDLYGWKVRRLAMGGLDGPFVCRTRGESIGRRMHRVDVWSAWRVATGILGPDRVLSMSVHSGRHTFASWALTVHPLRLVQAVLGHRSIGTTDRYAHVVNGVDPDGALFSGRSATIRPAAAPASAGVPGPSPQPNP